MRANCTQLYVHCVWATWDRLPLITPDIQEVIYASIIGQCHQLGGTVIAIGGIEEHVHLLTGIPPTLSVSELIKNIKGNSSHLINHKLILVNFSNGKAAMEHLLSAITILVLWLTTLEIRHFTIGINRCFLVGNCLVGSLAVETAAIQTKPA